MIEFANIIGFKETEVYLNENLRLIEEFKITRKRLIMSFIKDFKLKEMTMEIKKNVIPIYN